MSNVRDYTHRPAAEAAEGTRPAGQAEDAESRPKRLRVNWSKRERALMYHHEDFASNSGLLCHFIERLEYCDKTLAQHLEERGYDLKTLRFSVQKTGAK